jgi:cobaltochelatase CobN
MQPSTSHAKPSRIRMLIATSEVDEVNWQEWQKTLHENALAPRIAMQRVHRNTESDGRHAVGIGYGETLWWFAPVDDAIKRRLAIEFAASVLQADGFLEPPAALAVLRSSASSRESVRPARTAHGIVLLTHAETDLLALEGIRRELPEAFPDVAGHSLLGLSTAEALMAIFGDRRAPQLLAIVRIHGTVSSVPGLLNLIALAHREEWGLLVISGVADATELLPRTGGITPEFAANMTSYFMGGGFRNVAQALRYAAHEQFGLNVTFEAPHPMPAHGLYHPDLLITNAQEWAAHHPASQPRAAFIFYRAHALSGNLQFVDAALRALESQGFAAIGLFTSSLRDRDPQGVPLCFRELSEYPNVIVNTVAFPVFTLPAFEAVSGPIDRTAFESIGAPWIQAICCGTPRAAWDASARGLTPIEAAINVALPECDGRLISVPISFKEQNQYKPDVERLQRTAALARRVTVLQTKPRAEKRIAIVLSNAGGKAQRIGGAVGLDTPASLLRWLADMRTAGYETGELPGSAEELMVQLIARGCYDDRHPLDLDRAWRMPRERYVQWYHSQSPGFQRALQEMWGEPKDFGPTIAPPFWRGNRQATRASPLLSLGEPNSDDNDYLFAGLSFGNVFIAIQPPRGFGVDAEAVYHATDLAPCHHYAAFYRWLAQGWGADAILHFGTHGTLEWLPGKSLALSADCAPDALLGDLPLVYPFVVNNPGEGAQAKRRTHAVIVDHLVPPLTHADTYGPLATLAKLVEEYYRAEVLDTNKLPVLRRQVWDLVRTAHLEEDLKQIRLQRHGNHEHPWDERISEHGIPRALEGLSGRGFAHLLEDLDAYLCDLGRAQIRGGLHVFGAAPQGNALIDLLFAIVRSANGNIPSLVDAVTRAVGIDAAVLRAANGVWTEPISRALSHWVEAPATAGHIRAALDELSRELLRELQLDNFLASGIEALISKRFRCPGCVQEQALTDLSRSLEFVCDRVAPNLALTTDETSNLLAALDGQYVPAGPSGSPSRGMAHVLPTGRNFYSVDPRGLPTPAAWSTGVALAREALARHVAERGRWPESIVLSIWGTPTMRTGGDDLAQALALLGVRPVWEPETRRTCGLEIIPLSELERPRIDVTLRVSGFFRDAFPALMHLFDAAVQKVVVLEESDEQNFVRKHWLAEMAALQKRGTEDGAARRRASYRVFSSKPGAYGAGLMQLMDSSAWRDRADLAQSVLLWGGWAYSPESSDGVEAADAFRRTLAGVDLVLHNQDNLEQDLFDSTDYFEFHGGLVASVAAFSGKTPQAYFGDSSNPADPKVRSLQGEALRVYRSRVVNPKWLHAIQRHGYRGGLEMAATVDALFGFSATAGIVTDWMFEGVAQAFADGDAQRFLQRDNPWALQAIVERLLEAEQRQLWEPTPKTLQRLRSVLLGNEAGLEDVTENRR